MQGVITGADNEEGRALGNESVLNNEEEIGGNFIDEVVTRTQHFKYTK